MRAAAAPTFSRRLPARAHLHDGILTRLYGARELEVKRSGGAHRICRGRRSTCVTREFAISPEIIVKISRERSANAPHFPTTARPHLGLVRPNPLLSRLATTVVKSA